VLWLAQSSIKCAFGRTDDIGRDMIRGDEKRGARRIIAKNEMVSVTSVIMCFGCLAASLRSGPRGVRACATPLLPLLPPAECVRAARFMERITATRAKKHASKRKHIVGQHTLLQTIALVYNCQGKPAIMC
jgi:hypothetical protein